MGILINISLGITLAAFVLFIILIIRKNRMFKWALLTAGIFLIISGILFGQYQYDLLTEQNMKVINSNRSSGASAYSSSSSSEAMEFDSWDSLVNSLLKEEVVTTEYMGGSLLISAAKPKDLNLSMTRYFLIAGIMGLSYETYGLPKLEGCIIETEEFSIAISPSPGIMKVCSMLGVSDDAEDAESIENAYDKAFYMIDIFRNQKSMS